MARKNLVVLGSTGSIGTQTLEVAGHHHDRIAVVGLSANRQIDALAVQIRRFQPKTVAVGTEEAAATLRSQLSSDIMPEILIGFDGLVELAQLPEADLVLVATVGAIGMVPTIAALKAGKSVALANKEALVMGGDLVMSEAGGVGPRLIPVDSEHSAIFQCIGQHPSHEISQILLTGSGGPFRSWSDEQLRSATVSQALNHPNWSMGNKITIDSATLMNKGLELIEAMHLFGLPADRIRVVVHPQSIVHSLVEFQDRSVLAQLGLPDMRLPIQYSLSYPERWGAAFPCLDLFATASLTFEEPDLKRFPCLRLAYEAARVGGTVPALLSVCNEEAVHAFLEERIGFSQIPYVIEKVLDRFPVEAVESVEQLLELEGHVRIQARQDINLLS